MKEYTPTTRVTKKSEKWSVKNLRNRNTRISKPEEFHYHLLTITGKTIKKYHQSTYKKDII
ncbi:hypothetical protein GLU64_02390 [Nanohaloarchaea archaeon]|nr:hypothetical protein [Candidatus Nanohaloarchaea archaeon]